MVSFTQNVCATVEPGDRTLQKSRAPTEAHHIRFAQPRALGREVSDEYTVPVCRLHHRDLHSYGDEASRWAGVGIDPLPIALELWRRSHSSEPSWNYNPAIHMSVHGSGHDTG
jgi:hypothetical protein